LTAGATLFVVSLSAAALDLTAGSGAASGCPTSGRSVSITAAATAWLEPAPVSAYDEVGGRHYAPSHGQNRGVGIGFGEIAASTHGWCVGAVYRREYHGRSSKDLLDVVRSSRNDRPFDPDRTYALAMQYNAFTASGVRLRKAFELDFTQSTLKIGVGATLLKGQEGERQRGQGSIAAISATWATGSAYWDRIQSNLGTDDFNPYVTRGNPSGWGYSTDLELQWKTRTGWEANLVAMDLYGRLRWRDLPRAVKRLDNDRISYNENLDQSASITGIDSIVDLDQRIPAKYRLLLVSRPLQGWSALVSDDAVNGLHFPSIGVRHRAGDRSVDLAYDFRTDGVTLTFAIPALRIALSTDNSDPNRSTALGLALQSVYTW
jgi:hypothetical protein